MTRHDRTVKGWLQALLIIVTTILALAGDVEWAIFFAVFLFLSALK